jgi:hypothetical protein
VSIRALLSPDPTPTDALPGWLVEVYEAVLSIHYGEVRVLVNEGQPVQVDTLKKQRLGVGNCRE